MKQLNSPMRRPNPRTIGASRYQEACEVMPGGVNSPVRDFSSVQLTPLIIEQGQGARVQDIDGNQYIDYVCGYGVNIMGHNHPDITHTVTEICQKGLGFGTLHPLEIDLAQMIQSIMPNIEQIRFVNSGTEATMSACRLARAYTHKSKIIKFSGGYHGHADQFLIHAGSGALDHGHPSSAGISPAHIQETLIAEYNNLSQVEDLFIQHKHDIAAVIIEPIAGNINLVRAKLNFLQGLRQLCDEHGSLLIFDEVMTGFRVALGGAQSLIPVSPDLTCLGKIIGGGFPIGAFGGKQEVMQHLSPQGEVYQAGTFSGHPVTMAAGLTTLNYLKTHSPYSQLEQNAKRLTQGLSLQAQACNIPLYTDYIGGMFSFLFTDHADLQHDLQVKENHLDRFRQFYRILLEQGVYFAPSSYEVGFLSIAHQASDIDHTLQVSQAAFLHLNSLQREDK